MSTRMRSKTIVFWGREDILSCSVKYFLTAEQEWNVFNVSHEEDLASMIQMVDRVNPDVVVLHQENYGDELNPPIMLLQNFPNLKVIAFSAANTTMEVYSKQDVLIKSASDFISVVNADLVTNGVSTNQNNAVMKGGDL